MKVDSYDVIVCGGGPVGMGLAIELGQRAIRTLVIERYPEPRPVPKGQNLTQRTMEHFRAWECEQAVRAARTIPSDYGIGGLTAYGTLMGDIWYDWLQRDLVREFYAADNERLPQYATEAVLRARAAELPNVDIQYGLTVDRIEQDSATVTVYAKARDQRASATSFTGHYAVGCDGSRSIVRTQVGISQSLSDHDRLMALLVFKSTTLSHLLERFPGKSFYNVLRPELDGYWLFFGRVDLDDQWFFHAPVPASAEQGDFDYKVFLETAIGAPIDLEINHIGFWDLRFAIADNYQAGRVFIAGDAAHSHPPYGGYGINTGFEDARNLGWKLAATLQGWGGPDLLQSYHAERHGVFASTARDFIAKSIEEDRQFLRTFDPQQDRAAFDEAWRDRSKFARDEVGAFEPHYEGSPIVPGTVGTGGTALGRHRVEAVAGHHLTPMTLPSGGDLFDRSAAGFTLLDFGDADGVRLFTNAATALGVPLAVISKREPALSARCKARLVLVRPDAFIAWAGHDASNAHSILAVATGQADASSAAAN